MPGFLHIDPGDALPIWRQIEAGIARLVASRVLAPGAAAPSVRDLARDLQVNPATVVKAYQRLVDQGVLVVRRGEGTFVADAPPRLADAARAQALAEGALRFATVALTAGAGAEEAQAALAAAWAALAQGGREDRP